MSIYHIHHIIPKHMGGSNHPSNLIKLTVEEHAEAHKKLWEEHGNIYDRIAWLALSGQINAVDAIREAHLDKVRNGTHHLLDGNIQRKAALNRIKNGTHNDAELHQKVECPHCGKIGQSFVMRRWHFDKCKYKN